MLGGPLKEQGMEVPALSPMGSTIRFAAECVRAFIFCGLTTVSPLISSTEMF